MKTTYEELKPRVIYLGTRNYFLNKTFRQQLLTKLLSKLAESKDGEALNKDMLFIMNKI